MLNNKIIFPILIIFLLTGCKEMVFDSACTDNGHNSMLVQVDPTSLSHCAKTEPDPNPDPYSWPRLEEPQLCLPVLGKKLIKFSGVGQISHLYYAANTEQIGDSPLIYYPPESRLSIVQGNVEITHVIGLQQIDNSSSAENNIQSIEEELSIDTVTIMPTPLPIDRNDNLFIKNSEAYTLVIEILEVGSGEALLEGRLLIKDYEKLTSIEDGIIRPMMTIAPDYWFCATNLDLDLRLNTNDYNNNFFLSGFAELNNKYNDYLETFNFH